MDPIAISVGLILLGATSAFVFKPFRRKQRLASNDAAATLQPREARAAALYALRDLDFDFRTGKVSEDDYPALRAYLVAEAAKYVDAESDEEDRLEAMIRACKMAIASEQPCPTCGNTLDAEARFCPQCGTDLGMACPSCAKAVKAGDLFCRSCGSKLTLRVEAIA